MVMPVSVPRIFLTQILRRNIVVAVSILRTALIAKNVCPFTMIDHGHRPRSLTRMNVDVRFYIFMIILKYIFSSTMIYGMGMF
jgi:hypothetical protein